MENVIGIKFKPVGKIYYFESTEKNLNDGDGVIVETGRGIEYGELIAQKNPIVINEEDEQTVKRFVRKAVEKDYSILEQNNEKAVQFGL